jgi:hypothetical protein
LNTVVSETMSEQSFAKLSALYTRFADEEFRGRSPLYEAIARDVGANREALRFLRTLPPNKRQPNLLLASVRHLCGVARNSGQFLRDLLANTDAVRSIMLTRSTQTNEPARCATLLPVFAHLPQPLALIEVGASAGLCLLPDLYAYDYGSQMVRPDQMGTTSPPVFSCSVTATTPLPSKMPRIVWRAGLDLNPLDATDPSQVEWLETLVWPEQTQRLANLQAALKIAAAHQPRIVKADLRGDGLARLCREAPKDATLVVFHTAVLAYVDRLEDREDFGERAMSMCDYWISNENPRLLPTIAARTGRVPSPGRYLLSVNGVPTAWTDPHGTRIEWIADFASLGSEPK